MTGLVMFLGRSPRRSKSGSIKPVEQLGAGSRASGRSRKSLDLLQVHGVRTLAPER